MYGLNDVQIHIPRYCKCDHIAGSVSSHKFTLERPLPQRLESLSEEGNLDTDTWRKCHEKMETGIGVTDLLARVP